MERFARPALSIVVIVVIVVPILFLAGAGALLNSQWHENCLVELKGAVPSLVSVDHREARLVTSCGTFGTHALFSRGVLSGVEEGKTYDIRTGGFQAPLTAIEVRRPING